MSQPSGDTNNRNIIVEKERDTAKELVPTEIVSFSQHKKVSSTVPKYQCHMVSQEKRNIRKRSEVFFNPKTMTIGLCINPEDKSAMGSTYFP